MRRAHGLAALAAATASLALGAGAWSLVAASPDTAGTTGPAAPVAAPAAASGAPSAPAATREGFAPSVAVGARGASAERTPVPVGVSVPRIGVSSSLLPLGIAADGALQVPDLGEAQSAGWLTTSAVPGRPGPSVIAGHVDSRSGPAVFFRLHELVPGDQVDVQLDDGSTVTYSVDDVVRVSKDAFPTAEVYGPRPGPVLRLLTCGGAFDRATGHYEDNVIVFASLR
ncbi:class F sortase [Quadrisphaera setariae]|uniref:class F sortase n=1 Tax=Quadrisphaera setariae TaxID=2593304 RepID=UPI001C9CC562|nr:class F sortase [Quadrisphaera setariae]